MVTALVIGEIHSGWRGFLSNTDSLSERGVISNESVLRLSRCRHVRCGARLW